MGDELFLEILLVDGVRRLIVRGKLSPVYIGPYEINAKLNPMTNRLNLPAELERVHNVFHASQLRKFLPDPSHVIMAESVGEVKNLVYKERLMQILEYILKKTLQ